MVRENEMDGCLSCQYGTAHNPLTRWWCKDTGASPPRQTPPWPKMPPAPADDIARTQISETEDVPLGHVYIYTPRQSA